MNSSGQEQANSGEKTDLDEQQAKAENLLSHSGSVNKAQAVRGYYSNDDVTVLLDGLLMRNEFERIRGGNEQDIVRNLQTDTNTRTMVLAPIAENSEEAVLQLSIDINKAYEHNIEQVLIPMNIPNIHWYTIQLKLLQAPGGHSLEATIHDPLGIRKNSVVVEQLASHGIIVTKQIEGNLPKIQRGGGGAKNIYCGGYVARLIANLVLDDKIAAEAAWGCPDDREQNLREEDVNIVNEYNSAQAGSFGKVSIAAREIMKAAQDMGLLRSFIARDKEFKILLELEQAYATIPEETKLRIKSVDIPQSPADLFALVRDLYMSIPSVLKILLQTNAQGEIEKDENGMLKLDTTLEVEQIQKILVKLQMKCLELEGIEIAEHMHADKSKEFNEAPQESLGEFWMLYKGNYHTEEVNMEDTIAGWIKDLKQNEKKIAYLSTPKSAQLYVSEYINKALVFKEITMPHLRDKMKSLLYRHEAELGAFIEAPTVKHKIVPYLGYKELSESKFVGRTKELKAIQYGLVFSQTVIIKGMPGVGTTSIARHYAHSLEDCIPIWFNADSQATLAMSYRCFGESLGINLDKQEEDVVIRLVNNKVLSSEQKVLFIFDNLKGDYANHYVINLPKNVKLLITTTSHDRQLAYFGQEISLLSSFGREISLDPFGQQESYKYLANNGIEEEDMDLLVKDVYGLPQHLSLATGYIKNNRAKTVQDIAIELKGKTIFEVSLDQLTKEHEMEWELLQYMSWLDSNFIPEAVLLEIAVDGKEILWRAIEKLENLSLIRIVIEKSIRGVEVHSEIQAETAKYVIKYPNKSKDPNKLAEQLLQSLNKLLPYVTNNPNENWIKARLYLSSVESVFEHIVSRNINISYKLVIAALNAKLGRIYTEILIDIKKALGYNERALEIRQALYQSGSNPDVAASLNDVGFAYKVLGEANKSLDYCERSLKMRQALYPSGNHPDVATSLNNVGGAYYILGDVKKGIDYLERALIMRQALYQSGSNPDVAVSLSNVGVAYRALGDVKKGIDYLERALIMRQALYKGDHPDVATSLNNVGTAYYALGEVEKGVDYREQALKEKQALYLVDHTNIVASLNTVGAVALRNVRKGLNCWEKSLKMRQALYKGDHPDVADSLNNVGIAYETLGDVRKGLEYKAQALKMKQALHKGDHPDVASLLSNVGLAYQKLGDMSKGLDYWEKSLKMRRAIYPGDHPAVADSLNNVGVAYEALGDVRKGLDYLERALIIRQALYPGDHHDIIRSLNNVGLAYKGFGDIGKYSLYKRQAASREGFINKGDLATEDIIDVKQKLQKKVLNKIQKLAAKGDWSKKRLGVDCGVLGYLDEDYLKKRLDNLNNEENIKIALSLCFEAITIGIANSSGQDPKCATEFARVYPSIISEIVRRHPAYFTLKTIAEACLEEAEHQMVVAPSAVNAARGTKEEFSGEGSLSYDAKSYYKYHNTAIDKILNERLAIVDPNAKVKRLDSLYLRTNLATLDELVRKVSGEFSNKGIELVLVPINCENKHWLGLLFKKLDYVVEVIYMDSEQEAMSFKLRSGLQNSLSMHFYGNQFFTLRLDKQRYNNCGPEMIENFAYYLTGTRATQEGAVYVHSLLAENRLLDTEEYSLKLEENNKLIGFLANIELIRIKEVPLLLDEVVQRTASEEHLIYKVRSVDTMNEVFSTFVAGFLQKLGIELFCKKLLCSHELKKFSGMIGKYGIELPGELTEIHVLLDSRKFNKLVMNKIHPDKNPFGAAIAHEDTLFVSALRDKLTSDLKPEELLDGGLMKFSSMLHKSSIGFKIVDIIIDSARLAYEPSIDQLKKLALDYTHLHGFVVGGNSCLLTISGAEAVYQLNIGEYQKAFDVTTSTISAMALPVILAQINRPYLGFVYTLFVAATTAYNAAWNTYSFAMEFIWEDKLEDLRFEPISCKGMSNEDHGL